MAITKKIKIDDKEVPFRASATVPRLYRAKFRRDIFKDLVKLKQSVDKSIEENQKNDEVGEVSDEEVVDETKMQFDSFLDIDTLEMFENVAYIMARHADPDNVPDTPDEWLEQFSVFSIYTILPQLLELWNLNTETQVNAKKNIAKLTGK